MNMYVKVQKDVKIFVEDISSKPNNSNDHVILFIHGWPLNHKMWEYQLEYLLPLGYRCISVDLRGFGQSDRPFYGYDYDTMAHDIKTVIDSLKLKNIILVGHSMGAAIAIRYMKNYNGENISKLCLLSSAAPSFIQTANWKEGLTEEQIDRLAKMISVDRPNAIDLLRDMVFYRYVTPEAGTWFDNLCLEASGWGTSESLVALAEEHLFDDLDAIHIPTLIIHGVYDYLCPFESAVYLHEHIKDSMLLKLYASGHGAFFEEAEKISSAINLFAQGHLKITDHPDDSVYLVEKYTFL